MTQLSKTNPLPPLLSRSGTTVVARLLDAENAIDALIRYLSTLSMVTPAQLEAVRAELRQAAVDNRERDDAILKELRKLLDVPPLEFPDLSGLQKEAAAATAAIAELRELVGQMQASESDDLELPDLAPLEDRVAALEGRVAPEMADVDLEPLVARITALEGRPAPSPPDTSVLENRVAQLETMLGMSPMGAASGEELMMGATATAETPAMGTPQTQVETALPGDFPGRTALQADGRYPTIEAVAAASNEELDAVPGIGPATIAEMRAYLLSHSTDEAEVTNNE